MAARDGDGLGWFMIANEKQTIYYRLLVAYNLGSTYGDVKFD